MRKFAWFLITALATILSGCVGLFSDECSATPTSTASVSFDGLTWPKNPTEPVKIGKFVYTPTQVNMLSDSVASLEQARLGLCRSLRSLDKNKSTTPGEILQAQKSYNDTILSLRGAVVSAINNGASPTAVIQEVGNIAEKAKSEARKAEAKVSGSPEAVPLPSNLGTLDTPLGKEYDKLRNDLSSLSDRTTKLEEGLKKADFVVRQTIVVEGFSQSGVALPAETRQQLAATVLRTVRDSSPDQVLQATVVGYADSSGSHLSNVDLGLKRAHVVAALLSQFYLPIQIQTIASGGVAQGSSNARRVEVSVWSSMKI